MTQIFKGYSEFLNRENKDINGVSEEFAALHPNYEEDNSTNKGCAEKKIALRIINNSLINKKTKTMNIKPYLNQIAVAACICLAVAIIIASILIMEQNKRIQSLQGANRSLTSEVITYKNDNGKLLTQVSAAEIRSKDLESQLPDIYAGLKRDFDIKVKNLRAYMQAEFSAHGSGNASIRRLSDSTSIPFSGLALSDSSFSTLSYTNLHVSYLTRPDGSWYYLSSHGERIDTVNFTIDPPCQFEPFAMIIDDGYLSLMAEVYSDTNAPYEYVYSDTIKYAFHMKGKLFSKKQLYGTGMLSNPNARIINSDAVLVNEFRDRRWSVGPCLSWGVDQRLQTNFTVGFSIQYSLIKF